MCEAECKSQKKMENASQASGGGTAKDNLIIMLRIEEGKKINKNQNFKFIFFSTLRHWT